MHWKDQRETAISWVLSKEFFQLFPNFKLEDKLRLNGGSIDTVHQAYYRRRSMPCQLESKDMEDADGNKENSALKEPLQLISFLYVFSEIVEREREFVWRCYNVDQC